MKKPIRIIMLNAILLMLIFELNGCKDLEIEGRIAMKGNEPHSYLAIDTDNHGEFKVVGKFEKELREKYQNFIIRVKAIVVKEGIGPGFPPEIEVLEILDVRRDE